MAIDRRIPTCCTLVLVSTLGLAAPALAACPPVSLQPRVAVPTGDGPVEVVAADFSGDGIPDLAVTDALHGTVSILTANPPGGTFGPRNPVAVGGVPYGIAATDLDGDGLLDLVVANIGNHVIQVLRGLGSGQFAAPVPFAAGNKPYGVVVGDFNEDGVPDVAVANNGENNVRVLIAGNDGSGHWNGTFAPSVPYATSNLSLAIAAGDFNADGILDLVATEYNAGTVAVYLGKGTAGVGDGTFLGAAHTQAGPEPYELATGDFNEDGRLDLVVANGGPGGVRVLLGSNSGFFPVVHDYMAGVNMSGVGAGDIDGDGIVDLVVSGLTNNQLHLLRGGGSAGVGDGTFDPPVSMADCCFNVHLITADLDLDGSPDAVTCGYSSASVSVFMDGCVPDPNVPLITRIRDVPNDQGGKVLMTWTRSALDQLGGAVNAYRVWRQVPPETVSELTSRAVAADPGLFRRQLRALPNGATEIVYWEALATLPAQRLEGYGYTAATLQDSLPWSNPRFTYYVSALTANIDVYYDSFPDSGYSVDNLSPSPPGALAANAVSQGLHLHWQTNGEADLARYELHRSETPGFTPSPATLIATLTTNDYVDPNPDPAVTYKLAAVDVHENYSSFMSLATNQVTGVEGRPGTTWLAGPSPNPAHGPFDLHYGLARAGRVRIAVFDAQGRCVRTLVDAARPAGEATSSWDARDSRGLAVDAGLYWLELRTDARRIVRRFAMVR